MNDFYEKKVEDDDCIVFWHSSGQWEHVGYLASTVTERMKITKFKIWGKFGK